jgi:hypothetical protein
MKKIGYHDSMRRVRLFLSATALLACAVETGAPVLPSAEAQTVSPAASSGSAIDYHPDNRTLTVHMNGMPLRQAMEELSKQTHIRFQPPPPEKEFDNRPVTASFERMPIERAIKQLLGPSNTAMIYEAERKANSGGEEIILAEVKVIDLGIIPVVATPTAETSGNQSATLRRSPNPLKLYENQAKREAIKAERAEKKQRKNRGRENSASGNNANQNQTNDPASTSSSDSTSQNKGKRNHR